MDSIIRKAEEVAVQAVLQAGEAVKARFDRGGGSMRRIVTEIS